MLKRKDIWLIRTRLVRCTVGSLLFLAVLVIVPVLSGHVLADTGTNTYTNWYWPGNNYTEFAWDVTPLSDPSPQGFFWANQFFFTGGNGGYLGLQTEGPNDLPGKVAIFSIWSSISVSGPGVTGPFGAEGTGYQALVSYNWVVGQTYNLQVVDSGLVSGGTSWSASVDDVTTGVNTYVGQITVPSSWGGLTNANSSWTEFYEYNGANNAVVPNCSDINLASADFTNFTANNSSTNVPSSHVNSLQSGTTCTNSYVQDISGGVQQNIGADPPPSPPPVSTTPTTSPSSTSSSPSSSSKSTTPSTKTKVTTTAPTTTPTTTVPATSPSSTTPQIPKKTVAPVTTYTIKSKSKSLNTEPVAIYTIGGGIILLIAVLWVFIFHGVVRKHFSGK